MIIIIIIVLSIILTINIDIIITLTTRTCHIDNSIAEFQKPLTPYLHKEIDLCHKIFNIYSYERLILKGLL